MAEPLTENELKSWRVTLSTVHPTQTHPISGYWLERMLDTIVGLEGELAEQRALTRRQANGLQWAWYALEMVWQLPPPYYYHWLTRFLSAA